MLSNKSQCQNSTKRAKNLDQGTSNFYIKQSSSWKKGSSWYRVNPHISSCAKKYPAYFHNQYYFMPGNNETCRLACIPIKEMTFAIINPLTDNVPKCP